jgi:molybdopterin synthase catalytic subunit
MATIQVQQQPFDIALEHQRMQGDRTDIGAIASFVGICRAANDGANVLGMELEHYPGMTERALAKIVQAACARWALQDVTVIHRFGTLRPGEGIVLVLTASAHRADAFAACEFIMDYLKTEAPFWKKETTQLGDRWVEARASDTVARERW